MDIESTENLSMVKTHTEETVLQALIKLRLVGHVILDGGEGGSASEGEHDGAERQEEFLEPVDAPAEHEWVHLIHHLDEVKDTCANGGSKCDKTGEPERGTN